MFKDWATQVCWLVCSCIYAYQTTQLSCCYSSKWFLKLCTHKNLTANAYSRFILNHQNLEATKISLYRCPWVDNKTITIRNGGFQWSWLTGINRMFMSTPNSYIEALVSSVEIFGAAALRRELGLSEVKRVETL